ncbi:hypothetical protein SAMN05518849_11476 [Sphingobium sp. AP50]|uniref:hypothetical protein n=1 Tax=Sphingobium sp. AP50 TaxID=1884369 RepID=UPI0008C35DAF|nr:hypothetical protein [Sphingobium sp. AP50]SEJ81273.1 hypothetical protein SAMN05518849_11476 [Sphingobium sp. AP50]
MAFMSFNEFSAPHPDQQLESIASTSTARLSPLEWAVVALARRDNLDTLETPTRMGQAMAVIFGRRLSNRLADDHLEALRRMSVLVWHAPDRLTADEVEQFEEAGYTPEHLELLNESVRAATRH